MNKKIIFQSRTISKHQLRDFEHNNFDRLRDQNKVLKWLVMALFIALAVFSGCTPYMKGTRQLDHQNYDAAIESFEQELAQNPDNWKARKKLGYAYLKAGRLDQSIAEFQTVVGRQPADHPPTTAFSFAPQQRQTIAGQNPHDSFSNYYLGLAYLKNGQNEEAISTWRAYRNRKEPLVEKEIKKQLTLVEISESVRLARQALAEEQKLQTIAPESDTVAVFYFKDISPDSSFKHLQKAMATMIISDLSQVSSLQVLERFRVQYLLKEMQLGRTGIVEASSAPRYGNLLRAENLIVGTMEPGSLRVKTSVASTSKKDVIGSIAVGSEIEQFYVLQKEIVYNILKLLKVKFNSLEEERFSRYHTKSLQAVTYFGQGLDALDAGQWDQARRAFDRAAEEDPAFKLALFYRDATPAAAAPDLASLADMSGAQISEIAEENIDQTMALQNAIDTNPDDPGEVAGIADTADTGTGSVSFSW
jgi:tetratricopeptide (TPR) repeat protein